MAKYPKMSIDQRVTYSAEIIISYETMLGCRYLVDKVSPKEVQWFMEVESAHTVDESGRIYLNYFIDGIYIPNQTVTGAEAATDAMQMYSLHQAFKAEHRLIDDDGNDSGPDLDTINSIVSRMHVWCHSHPFSKVQRYDDEVMDSGAGVLRDSGTPTPSGQDFKNFEEWISRNQKANVNSPVIMLIFGNDEGVYSRVYDPMHPEVEFVNVPVRVESPVSCDFSDIDKKVEERVTVRTPAPASKFPGFGSSKSVLGGGRSHSGFYFSEPTFTPSAASTPYLEDDEAAAEKTLNRMFGKNVGKILKDCNKTSGWQAGAIELEKLLTDRFILPSRLSSNQCCFLFVEFLTAPDEQLAKHCESEKAPQGFSIRKELLEYLAKDTIGASEMLLAVECIDKLRSTNSAAERKSAVAKAVFDRSELDIWEWHYGG